MPLVRRSLERLTSGIFLRVVECLNNHYKMNCHPRCRDDTSVRLTHEVAIHRRDATPVRLANEVATHVVETPLRCVSHPRSCHPRCRDATPVRLANEVAIHVVETTLRFVSHPRSRQRNLYAFLLRRRNGVSSLLGARCLISCLIFYWQNANIHFIICRHPISCTLPDCLATVSGCLSASRHVSARCCPLLREELLPVR